MYVLTHTVIMQNIATKMSITKPHLIHIIVSDLYPLSICKFIILRKSKRVVPCWFCDVSSSFTGSVELCYKFICTITNHVTTDNNRSTFMVRTRLQHILYDIDKVLMPLYPLHSLHIKTYLAGRSTEAVRHKRSSLICFFTAKISVFVNSLLLLFVSR